MIFTIHNKKKVSPQRRMKTNCVPTISDRMNEVLFVSLIAEPCSDHTFIIRYSNMNTPSR